MKKFALLTSVLLTAPFSMSNVSAQCVASQDCASLGYTETSCESGGIKCPFGNAWACPQSGGCTYGSVYYSDGTCINKYIADKTPIGVIAYDEDGEKWIIALENASSTQVWSTEEIDVPEIENYTTTETVINDMKSCENTEAMLALGADKYPAAAAAKNYAPTAARDTKGKWCLPAMGMWHIMSEHSVEINFGINLTKNSNFISGGTYWTSSEYNKNSAWTKSTLMSVYNKYSTGNIISNHTVRPIMKI